MTLAPIHIRRIIAAALYVLTHYTLILVGATTPLLLGSICIRIAVGYYLLLTTTPISIGRRSVPVRRRSQHIIAFVAVLALLFTQALLIQSVLHPLHIPHVQYRGIVLLILLSACDEEILFRGVLFRILPHPIVYSALAFSLLHLHLGAIATIHALLAGILLAAYYRRHHRIALNIAVHFLYNAIIVIMQRIA